MGHIGYNSRMSEFSRPDSRDVIRDHRRQWRDCLYVYPVISRRSGGLSVGVNLNPDKRCNFACLYCQIDRRIDRNLREVDIGVLRRELAAVLEEASSGRIWRERRFAATPPEMRRINDIAFSGDGEPTSLADFDRAVLAAVEAKRQARLPQVKIVVITNASKLDSPQVARSLELLDANNGEIWAKLDAGTQRQFQRISRPQPGTTLQRIIDNITAVARSRPVVIQSLFMRLDGCVPADDELDAYCDRLGEIISAGGHIGLVQVHTIARSPASDRVAALSDRQLDAVAARIRAALGAVDIRTYYGLDA